jgi:NitT/TauT family transport system substrate-binding protein
MGERKAKMKMLKVMSFGAGIAVSAIPSVSAAQDLTTINMINPLPRSTEFFPLIVAEALGYFEEEGVVVNLLPSDTSIPYVSFLENGQADIAMVDPFEAVNAVNAGVNIRVVYEVMQSAPEGIAVLADSDVQTMADLAGTTVGLVSDRDQAFLQSALNTVGLSLDDVDMVILGGSGPTLAVAMRDNQVSAIAGASSDWIALIANGIETRLITPEELKTSPANNFAVTTDTIENNRAAMDGYFRAWSKGMHAATVDRDAVAEMVRRAVPAEWENEETGQFYLDIAIGMNVSVTDRPGEPQTEVWAALQPQMMAAGGIEREVPVDQLLDKVFIDAADDFDRDEVAAELAAWKAANM